MQKNNIVETSPAFIKTDGIKSGTHVSIPANDPEMPFTGVVVNVMSLVLSLKKIMRLSFNWTVSSWR